MKTGEYVLRAKNAVLEWALGHEGFLNKCENHTRAYAIATGAGSLALMKYLGIEDPGTLSKYMVTPAAVMFAAGEGIKVLGEYARDWKRGETDPVKNFGYVARIAAPLYAVAYGANGVWEGGNDVAIPVVSWAMGTGLTATGNARIGAKKRDATEHIKNTYPNADDLMMAAASVHNPDAITDTFVREVPLKTIRALKEGALD